MRTLLTTLALATGLCAQADWQRVVTAASPNAQYHAAMAYDLARARTVLFGGRNTATVFAETWEYDGVNWTLAQPATAPAARVWSRLAYDLAHGVVVMFGGDVGSTETWTYDGTNWTLQAPLHSPPGRNAQAMWYDTARLKVMLFGGSLRPSGTLVNDTWAWDGTDWTQLQPASTPLPRYSIDAAYDVRRDRAVLFGGAAAGNAAQNDTWEWDGSNWSRVATATLPTPRWGNKLAYNMSRERVVMVGGRDASGSTPDTWEFDGFDWHAIGTVTPLTPVENHAVVYDLARDRIVSYGGYPPIQETWEYGDSTAARFVPYGLGCVGTAGPPHLDDNGAVPTLGQPFTMTVRNLPQAAPFVLGALGLSRVRHGGLPLPAPLAALGMPGCTLFVGQFALFVLPQGATSASWMVPIPNQPALLGVHFYPQALVPDPAANALGLTLSDAAEATIG